MRRLPIFCLGALLAAGCAQGAGCGEGGVAGGATVSVYVAAPLCGEAKGAAGKAGELRVRTICLPPVEGKGGPDLAAVGAGARRATEDSTSVAYLEAPGPAARFSRPILEAADIAWIKTDSATTAMHEVLKALQERGSSSPRDAVGGSFEP